MKHASLLLGFALIGCSGVTSNAPTVDEPVKASNAPVIAALKTHDGKVALVGGGSDLRVVVTKDDGTVVADNATLDELRTKDPETWMLVKSAVAQTRGSYVDATFVATPKPRLK